MKIVLISFIFLFFVGCGRKQKDIFHFSDQKPVPKINRLLLPSITGLKVESTLKGNKICWNEFVNTNFVVKEELEFLGYNVYRLVKCSFIPKSPINKKPLKNNFFVDKNVLQDQLLKKETRHCYLVRAVLKKQGRIMQGVSSQVVCVKKFPPT